MPARFSRGRLNASPACRAFQFVRGFASLSSGISAPSRHTYVRNAEYAMGLRTLIVDDEPIARQVLREELEQLDEIEIMRRSRRWNSGAGGESAVSPELIFLDLQMPGLSGFDVIRKLPSDGRIPMVVIVTAFDRVNPGFRSRRSIIC